MAHDFRENPVINEEIKKDQTFGGVDWGGAEPLADGEWMYEVLDKDGKPTGETVRNGVEITHGIHKKILPVGGSRISEVRDALQHEFNIDPLAVAVICGEVVPEDHVICENDMGLLTFVKKAAVKGLP